MRTRQATAQPHRALAPVLLLVFALLLAQTLGFVHRIVHHPSGAGHAGAASALYAGSSVQAGPLAQAAPVPIKAGGFLASLFQHNDEDPTCRIYDQSSGFDTLASVPAVVLPMAMPSFVLLYFQGEFLARWVALFDARGPPSVR